MMTANGKERKPTTISELFLPGKRDLTAAVQKTLKQKDSLSKSLRIILGSDLFVESLTKEIGTLFDVSLEDILVRAWNKHRSYRKLVNEGPEQDGPEYLPLADHTVRSKHAPKIEILEEGKVLATIEFPIDLEFKLEGIILKIEKKKIVQVGSTRVSCKGTLKCEGATLVERKMKELSLPAVWSV